MVQELQIFLISAFWGMIVIVYYDFFRIIRAMKKHTAWMTAAEDLVFCLGTGCLIFAVLYTYIQGQVRGFVLIGMAAGMALYNWGISPYIRGFILFAYRKVKRALKKCTKQSTINSNNDAKEGKNE